jgi:carbamoyltransferase
MLAMPKCILGISLGHDASVAVIVRGEIISFVLRERHSRTRHHYGIDRRTIETALKDAGLRVSDVAVVAVTSTQHMPALIDEEDYVSLALNGDSWNLRRRSLSHDFPRAEFRPMVYQSDLIYDAPLRSETGKLIVGEARARGGSTPGIEGFFKDSARIWKVTTKNLPSWYCFTYLSPIFGPRIWQEPFCLAELPDFLYRFQRADASRSILHAEIDVKIGGIELPGYFLFHHVAHAGASFYSSPYDEAAILTHDGGLGPESGFIFIGKQNEIRPLGPHWLECGKLYEFVSEQVGLGMPGGPGKLMGLAGYGRGALTGILPRGNFLDWRRWVGAREPERAQSLDHYPGMLNALLRRAEQLHLNTDSLTQLGPEPNRLAAEVAFAVQTLTEESLILAVEGLRTGLSNSGLTTPELCVSGGVALNCPANTRIYNSGQFRDVHIEPYCEDGGLAIGAAQYVYHHVLGNSRPSREPPTSCYAMLGVRRALEDELEETLSIYSDVTVETSDTWWLDAASDLARNNMIAIFQSRSEAGPRALGHRSLLAHPGVAANWRRLNRVKDRELWRPFGPVVLESKIKDWFIEGPPRSPFMLFTYKCKPECEKLLPAVVHADGTSRIQTVVEQDGPLFDLLKEFERLTGLPVALNTSFNGPSEPIIETVREALSFFLNRNVDTLYLEKFVIRRDRRARAAA